MTMNLDVPSETDASGIALTGDPIQGGASSDVFHQQQATSFEVRGYSSDGELVNQAAQFFLSVMREDELSALTEHALALLLPGYEVSNIALEMAEYRSGHGNRTMRIGTWHILHDCS